MNSAINNALSGLTAASTRLQVAANNIANSNSTETDTNGTVTVQPYQPEAVAQTAQAPGGVQARVVPTTDQPQQIYQPGSVDANAQGLVAYPNVDPAQQLVQLQIASYDFKANLKTLSIQNDMQQSLLDIIS